MERSRKGLGWEEQMKLIAIVKSLTWQNVLFLGNVIRMGWSNKLQLKVMMAEKRHM